jgi:ectoine hydroxylase-related dioxygenase (phytanoyl-CoA dioxygenase family)
VLEALDHVGVVVVEEVLSEPLLAELRPALYRARQGVLREIGAERLTAAPEVGVVRIPMLFEPVFYRLLELPEVLEVVDATVSSTAILHLQNGLILSPVVRETGREGVASGEAPSYHMDFRRVLGGAVCSVNTLFAIDAFAAANGATLVVPGTHQAAQPPAPEYLRRHGLPVECAAGSMLVFDSTLWHAAGCNRTERDRIAINQQFTRSYFKQQIDYVRALGDATVLAQPPRTQQLLGWHTRVASSLDEFYRPPAERLYRAGQG